MKPHEIQVMDLALSAKTPLEQSPILAFPNNETSARFQLSIENGSGGSYRAELATVGGEMVFSAQSLQAYGANPAAIYFEVPRQVLKTGNYQIKLSRAEGKVTSYYFRVK